MINERIKQFKTKSEELRTKIKEILNHNNVEKNNPNKKITVEFSALDLTFIFQQLEFGLFDFQTNEHGFSGAETAISIINETVSWSPLDESINILKHIMNHIYQEYFDLKEEKKHRN